MLHAFLNPGHRPPGAVHRLVVVAMVVTLGRPAAADTEYLRAIEHWRQERETRLRADDGWLTVTGLHWLRPGANRFGAGKDNEIVLAGRDVPERAGVLTLSIAGGEVTVEVAPGARVTTGGRPVSKMALRPDTRGEPDVLAIGPLRLFVIERSRRLAVRVRDLEAPARRTFKGPRWFPVREPYRVVGRFVAHATPRRLAVPNVLGVIEQMESPGTVVFHLAGREHRLDPVYETPAASELFFIFRDLTAGRDTYASGRFLYAELPRDGTVVLDFNKAYTPPCAFTRFATCPLPPAGNRLRVRVEAGELDPRIRH